VYISILQNWYSNPILKLFSGTWDVIATQCPLRTAREADLGLCSTWTFKRSGRGTYPCPHRCGEFCIIGVGMIPAGFRFSGLEGQCGCPDGAEVPGSEVAACVVVNN